MQHLNEHYLLTGNEDLLRHHLCHGLGRCRGRHLRLMKSSTVVNGLHSRRPIERMIVEDDPRYRRCDWQNTEG